MKAFFLAFSFVALALPGFGDMGATIPSAIKEAQARHKPLLIGFFAVWCPYCNAYREKIFLTPQFKEVASHFVRLEVDVEDTASAELLSRFKIAGFPQIVTAAVTESGELIETSHVKGLVSLPELILTLQNALTWQPQTDPIKEAEKQIEKAREDEDFALALSLSTIASAINPDNVYFKLMKLDAEAKFDPSILTRTEQNNRLVLNLLTTPKPQSSQALAALEKLVTSHAKIYGPDTLRKLDKVYDELESREDPHTYIISGTNIALSRLDKMRVAWAKLLGDAGLQQQLKTRAVSRMQELEAIDPNSKGMSSLLGGAFENNHQYEEARALYERLIMLYPNETTFYDSMAQLLLKQNQAKLAQPYNEKALKVASSDGLIYEVALKVRILTALGEYEKARTFGENFLKEHDQFNPNPMTKHDLDGLQEAIFAAKPKR